MRYKYLEVTILAILSATGVQPCFADDIMNILQSADYSLLEPSNGKIDNISCNFEKFNWHVNESKGSDKDLLLNYVCSFVEREKDKDSFLNLIKIQAGNLSGNYKAQENHTPTFWQALYTQDINILWDGKNIIAYYAPINSAISVISTSITIRAPDFIC
jgi:hypothetical protein